MSTPLRRTGVLALLAALIATLAVVAAPDPAEAAQRRTNAQYERHLVKVINDARDVRDLKPLRSRSLHARCLDRRFAEHRARVLHRTGTVIRRDIAGARGRCAASTHATATRRYRGGPRALLRTWMRRPAHRRILMSPGVDHVAVGAVRNRRGWSVSIVISGTTRTRRIRTAAPVATPEVGDHTTVDVPGTGTQNPAPTDTPAARVTAAEYRSGIYTAVNERRADAGLAPLTPLECAESFAQAHTDWVASPDGSFTHSPKPAREAACGRPAGENLGYYPGDDPADLVDAWMDSDGHRANILSARYTHIGVGVTPDSVGWYGTQVFVTVQSTVGNDDLWACYDDPTLPDC